MLWGDKWICRKFENYNESADGDASTYMGTSIREGGTINWLQGIFTGILTCGLGMIGYLAIKGSNDKNDD